MALTDKDKERINLMNPVANDVKLGDIVKELQEGGGKGPKGDPGEPGPKGDPGTDGADGFGTEEQYNDIIARLEALEDEGGES